MSASLTPGPTVTPVPSGWPYTWEMNDALFGEDGRVVLIGSSITVLDGSGSTVPGWPWTPGPTGDAALRVAFGPDGSLYVAARVGSPGAWSWSLHRLGPDGKEMAGFPVDLPAVSFCDLAVNEGDAFIYCQDEDEEGGVVTSEVTVVRPNGSTRDGWPVRMPGGFQAAGFGPDGRVYLHAGSGEAQIKITALASDGTKVAGWPRTLTRGDGEPGVQIDAQGRVRVTSRSDITEQCGLPDETVYTMLRADGSTGPGWPVTAKGWSSDPELGDDGTMVVISETGRVTAYSSRGAIKHGWPVRRISVAVGCWDGSRPWAAGDGTMVIVGDGSATLLTADGRVVSGWPVTLPYEVAMSCSPCTPGPGGPLAPAVSERAVYVGGYSGVSRGMNGQPHVMVVERDGSMPSDAQRLIGTAGDELRWLRVAPTGRVWALLISQDGSTGTLHLVAEDAVRGW